MLHADHFGEHRPLQPTRIETLHPSPCSRGGPRLVSINPTISECIAIWHQSRRFLGVRGESIAICDRGASPCPRRANLRDLFRGLAVDHGSVDRADHLHTLELQRHSQALAVAKIRT
jgi:hypothetical protein